MDPFNATAACETVIQERELQNDSSGRFFSENVIARRLLACRDQLADAYTEAYFSLRSDGHLRTFWGLVVSAAADWGRGLDSDVVAERAELTEVNRRIAELAESLAELLDRREEFRGKPGDFADNTFFNIAELVSAAAHDRDLYQYHLEESLAALRARFDWKYWPSLGDVLRTLATDAEAAQGPKETASEAADDGFPRHATARFFEVLFRSMSYAKCTSATLPDDFNVSDATLAAIANSALSLAPIDRVRATEVRDFRPEEWLLDGMRFDDTGP